ncbi:MAG: Crp/Fnr family transcriptional regulator [Thiomicrospira sp.]|jgi:CRP-like cAMP-binding protein|nr:Crp/Fnr family transcriptional regulator [Thiomicrospira sp.]
MALLHENLLRAFLCQVVPFADDELERSLGLFRFHCFEPKDYIFCAGDSVQTIHFVLVGIGRYFYVDQDGSERNKSLVSKGGAFASMTSLIEGQTSPFYTQALTACVTASIRYEDLQKLASDSPRWMAFILTLYERLVLKKEKREAGLLLLSAKQRYVQFLQEFGADGELIPLKHVAMYLGITDVSLSRIRREMGLT